MDVFLNGLNQLGESLGDIEITFQTWMFINHPKLFTKEYHDLVAKSVHIDTINAMRDVPKHEFFKLFLIGLAASSGFLIHIVP